MLFFILSNSDIQFAKKELTWGFYTAVKALATTKRVKLIDKKKSAKVALDKKFKTLVVYVAALEALLRSAKMTIHPSQTAQIAAWKQNEAPTKVSPKFTDYAEVFSFDLAIKLPENTSINKHAIKLEKGK